MKRQTLKNNIFIQTRMGLMTRSAKVVGNAYEILLSNGGVYAFSRQV